MQKHLHHQHRSALQSGFGRLKAFASLSLLGTLIFLCGCGEPPSAEITIYCGRNENLIGPLMKDYQTETGLKLNVRYGKSGELAKQLMTEGDKSPADLFISQDIGAMAAVHKAELLGTLPANTLKNIPAKYREANGYFTGISGRLRTVVYNTDKVKPADLPDSIHGFTDPKWKGRIGWAPLNGSFQLFITAMRAMEGEEKTREWLAGIKANDARVYPKNTPIVAATGDGEIDVGFVNHYYLYKLKKERGDAFPADNHFLKGGPGALMNLACAGPLRHTTKGREVTMFVDFLQSDKAQAYFAENTYEFPLVDGVDPWADLPDPGSLDTPDIDPTQLDDLEGTLKLLEELELL